MNGTIEHKLKLKNAMMIKYCVAVAIFFCAIMMVFLVNPDGQNGMEASGYTFVALVTLFRIVWIMGCVDHARYKGYTAWLGAIGVIGLWGLMILSLLPDKYVLIPTNSTPPPVQWSVVPAPGSAFHEI